MVHVRADDIMLTSAMFVGSAHIQTAQTICLARIRIQ
jgi:hypothetical protein